MSAHSAIQAHPFLRLISHYVHFIPITENCVARKSELQKDGYKAERAHVISDAFTGMRTQTKQTTSGVLESPSPPPGAPGRACCEGR